MKKNTSLLLAAVLMLALNACSNIHRLNKAELTIVPVSDVMTDKAKWTEIGKDILFGKTLYFQILQGQSIPLKLSLETPIGKLNAGKNTLFFTKDVYLQVSRSSMRVSPDGYAWADINDMNSIRTLFDFSKGDLTMGLSADATNGPSINIDLSAK